METHKQGEGERLAVALTGFSTSSLLVPMRQASPNTEEDQKMARWFDDFVNEEQTALNCSCQNEQRRIFSTIRSRPILGYF
jgi:hypothetical protein